MRRLKLLATALLAMPAAAAAAPLATGRWEYRLSWNGIPAANAVVAVSEDEAVPGSTYRVEATAHTNWFADIFWSLRARAASRFRAGSLAPLGFRFDREIDSEPSVTEVVFRNAEPRATGIYRRRGETKVIDAAEPAVVDPITAVFQAMAETLDAGRSLRYEVFTGESRYRLDLEVKTRERIEVASQAYAAWRIEPQVWKIGTGLDRRLRRATIWVSEAPPRTLLRIRSEVFIGAVNCDLVSPARAADSSS